MFMGRNPGYNIDDTEDMVNLTSMVNIKIIDLGNGAFVLTSDTSPHD